MVHCFVHAPNKYGWTGEILLHLEKDAGIFKQNLVEKIFNSIYTRDDFDDMIFDPAPSFSQIDAYQLRMENGLMQRLSVVNSYEDMHFEDWIKTIGKHYPNLIYLFMMLPCRNNLITPDPQTLDLIK